MKTVKTAFRTKDDKSSQGALDSAGVTISNIWVCKELSDEMFGYRDLAWDLRMSNRGRTAIYESALGQIERERRGWPS